MFRPGVGSDQAGVALPNGAERSGNGRELRSPRGDAIRRLQTRTSDVGDDGLVSLPAPGSSELAEHGYVVLAPDYPYEGEYQPDLYAMGYVSGTMKAIYDNIRAIDLLQSLPNVDPERIGCIGHSLGGHNSIFTATFDL